MKKILLSLVFLVGCGTFQEAAFHDNLDELTEFRNEMSTEFIKGFAEAYADLKDNPFGQQGLRQAFVQFFILMDEIDACINAAPLLREKLGEEKALYCAKASIMRALMFIKSLGVEPVDVQTVPTQTTME